MQEFSKKLDSLLSGPMTKLSEQRHLKAVRDGIIATLPIIIVGSFLLLIASPPFPSSWKITMWLQSHAATILIPFRLSMSLMTLYATFAIGSSLAKSYDLDSTSAGIIATLGFMMTFTPVNVLNDANAGLVGWSMELANLSGSGMFVGIITSIISVEIYRFSIEKNLTVKMPKEVPYSVSKSFEALIPTALVILIIGGLTHYIGFDWHSVVSQLVKPIVQAADTLPSVLLIVFLITFFWAFGIHGAAVVGTLARPIWLELYDANAAADAMGSAIPHIAPEPFYQWFVWIGGTGLAISILFTFFSKSVYGKSIGKTSIIPSLFNINEPIMFGAPIVLNPLMIAPFMISSLLNAIISWYATTLGFVNRVTVIAPWTLPGPIGAFLATKDIRAIFLSVFLIILSIIIYYPFFKIYDKQLLEKEQQSEI